MVRPPAIAAAAAAWFVFLLVAPVAPAPISALAYALGSLVCHQLPARSFHYGLVQLPVCARCAGIYAGAAFGSALVATNLPRMAALSPRTVLLASSVPLALTVALEWAGAWAPGNAIRALTGVILGVAAAFVVVGAAALPNAAQASTTLHYDRCAPRRPNVPGQPPTHT